MMKIDESKMRILDVLVKPMTVTEISKKVGLSKATVSYHLKSLEKIGLVKVESTKIEKNFIKKYYVTVLNNPEYIFPQEGVILSDFRPNQIEFFRTLIRLLNLINLENEILLRKVGYDVGYFQISEMVNGELYSGLADVWERLKLGRVTESSKDKFIVEDCYNCSGLPAIGKPYCKIDEGILEGVLRRKTGEKFIVREIKCWGTGDEICEFLIRKIR